jgi:hypothetical protein
LQEASANYFDAALSAVTVATAGTLSCTSKRFFSAS